MSNFLRQPRGFALIEVLAVAGILGVTMLGLGVGFKKVGESREQVRGVSTALAVEAALQAAMQEPSQYAAIANVLKAGVENVPDFNFQIRVTNQAGVEQAVTLPINQDVLFNIDGQPCTSCTDWVVRARIGGVRKTSNPIPIYALAYRFEFNTQKFTLSNLGSATGPFQPRDFKWMVPTEAYQNVGLKNCDISSKDVIVTGINPDTLEVKCLKVGDNTQCAADEVATGWEFEGPPGNPSRTLKMGCRKLSVSANCPTLGNGGYEYVVNSLRPVTATSNQPQGQCVFIAKEVSTAVSLAPAANTSRATFDVCPEHYRFQPAAGTSNGCLANVFETFRGWRNEGCPAGWAGQSWVRDVVPAPLVVNGVIQNQGRRVVCSLTNERQVLPGADNWAGYTAKIAISGTCELETDAMKSFSASNGNN